MLLPLLLVVVVVVVPGLLGLQLAAPGRYTRITITLSHRLHDQDCPALLASIKVTLMTSKHRPFHCRNQKRFQLITTFVSSGQFPVKLSYKFSADGWAELQVAGGSIGSLSSLFIQPALTGVEYKHTKHDSGPQPRSRKSPEPTNCFHLP